MDQEKGPSTPLQGPPYHSAMIPGTRSQLVCKSNARRDFDVFGKPSYDFAKSPNLILNIGQQSKRPPRATMLEDSFRPFVRDTASSRSARNDVGSARPAQSNLTESGSFDLNTPPAGDPGGQEDIKHARNSRYNFNKVLKRNTPDQFALDGDDDDRTCQNLSRRRALSFVIQAN
jgi:hypothetical protein